MIYTAITFYSLFSYHAILSAEAMYRAVKKCNNGKMYRCVPGKPLLSRKHKPARVNFER